MTKADLVNEVMEAIGPGVTKKDCSLILEGFLKAAKRGLVKGETIEIRGFGTLAVKKRKSRVARNPKTGKVVQVPLFVGPGDRVKVDTRTGDYITRV